MSKIKIYLPIAIAIVLAAGICLGYNMKTGQSDSGQILRLGRGKSKVSTVLDYVKKDYVDSVKTSKLETKAIKEILSDLDPHSQYIASEEFNDVNDPLKGNFEGIGVQFRIEKDTVMIIRAISGGPSEKVGIRGGDRIVTIEGDTVAGVGISNDEIINRLKGEKGTKVQVGIFRRGVDDLVHFTITRDVIPTYSVDISFMPTDSTGYIKLSKFSATSYKEVKKALTKLNDRGMNNLILDLRSNAGGYLQSAIKLTDEFLKDEQLIVYTEGRNRPKKHAYATGKGAFEEQDLVILIDEGSASASEILAGAVQDNDRGLIIGRRSFGKGLVQEQKRLKDGSAVRLTVARYHTPTGRCIQRPYEEDRKEYYHDIYDRWKNGELESPDSIRFNDSLKYQTPAGRTVYGGGGIMPDIFVSIEEERTNDYIGDLMQKGVFYRFAFDYADRNRQKLKEYDSAQDYIKEFTVDAELLEKFFQNAKESGVPKNDQLYEESLPEIKNLLKALIGRNIFDNEGFYPVYLKTDSIFQKALRTVQKDVEAVMKKKAS
ncbi:MAG: PDZ domain-containing protein [Bacteroidales bacterium]|nr:PDZ domain-containing protein [Bacteroidales bacterium]MCF8332533.1 PDZ domain-containing protein [Bacteroidales bacterium]